tara:strand:+ start:2316 stop:2909 length:594 start_codon:yes stop_codon:yes gene_type:complete
MKRKFFTFKPFLDMLFCVLMMLIAILFLLKTEEKKTKARPPNAIYEVVLTWDGKAESDLDLYVQSAAGHVVSFNNREGGDGSYISLDHDALGRRNNFIPPGQKGTITKFHEEVTSFRGITEGEHIVTIHAYAFKDKGPIKCTVKLVKVKPYTEVVVKELVFNNTGQELTAFRFTTDSTGNVVDISYLEANLVRPIGQ